MNGIMKHEQRRCHRVAASVLLCVTMLLGAPSPAADQKEKKKKKEVAASSDSKPILSMPDEQQIDYMISSMLGAWQLGDIERLHQCYADEAVFVSGFWTPPVVGWANYLVSYKQQHARTQQIRMDRSNTLIKVDGGVGWAAYQWEFSGTVDGQPMTSLGQTTLVMEKRSNGWVIVHNHTSVAQAPPAAAPANAENTPPRTQPAPTKPGPQ